MTERTRSSKICQQVPQSVAKMTYFIPVNALCSAIGGPSTLGSSVGWAIFGKCTCSIDFYVGMDVKWGPSQIFLRLPNKGCGLTQVAQPKGLPELAQEASVDNFIYQRGPSEQENNK